jgi:hypothetical protein
LSGSVFVVTEALTNMPMGGIKVFVFQQEKFQRHMLAVESKYQQRREFCRTLNATVWDHECIEAIGLDASEFYVTETPPNPVAFATTDAAGKFTMTIPKPGEYTLFTQSKGALQLDKDIATYRWLISLKVDGTPAEIILDNSKMIEYRKQP